VVWIAVGLLVTGAAVAGTIFFFGGKNAGPGAPAVESELPASPVDGILDKLEAGQRRFRDLERKAAESQKAVDAATTTAEQAEATVRRFAGLTKDGGLDLIEDARKARQRVTELARQHALNTAAMRAEAERMEQLGREFTTEYQRERDRAERLPPDQRAPAQERLERWRRRFDAATR
jgi:hypothetical protein